MRLHRAARALAMTAFLTLGAGGSASAQSSDQSNWKLTGSYLNLYSRSRTVVPEPRGFTLDLNRLRLRAEAGPIVGIRFDIQYDNELLLGSYLETPQFALANDRVTTSFDLGRAYVARRNLVARHSLYRGVMEFSVGRADLKVGRQRIPLGTGYFWSPLDLLNPIDPTRLERDYRAGADAVLIEQKLGALGRAAGIYVPATARLAAVGAGYVHGNARGTDYSLLLGRFRGNDAIGADFGTSRGGVGIRGETVVTRTAADKRYARAMLGADYGFANSVTLTAETYYNGQGASDPAHYDVAGVLAGRVVNVARWYGGVGATYQVTPLVKAAAYGIVNADDRSGVLWPRVEWSARSDVDVAAGVQRFIGGSRTEYGRLSNLVHVEARWFF